MFGVRFKSGGVSIVLFCVLEEPVLVLLVSSDGSQWAHLSCALWIPEVSLGCSQMMEPICDIAKIPVSAVSHAACVEHCGTQLCNTTEAVATPLPLILNSCSRATELMQRERMQCTADQQFEVFVLVCTVQRL